MIIDKVHSRCFGVINKPKQNPAMEGHLSNFRLNNAPIDTFGSLSSLTSLGDLMPSNMMTISVFVSAGYQMAGEDTEKVMNSVA
ncbi:hypothetical protein WN944_000309 [Citrus x changshan-huyou]|uniref:Uncharacterized protein n=1 Tax=Citrus x changshan-huyou TaxID=2935761 RepID=A0AAP0MCM4_9ROSI